MIVPFRICSQWSQHAVQNAMGDVNRSGLAAKGACANMDITAFAAAICSTFLAVGCWITQALLESVAVRRPSPRAAREPTS
jgi:hypothetical protein